MARPIKTGLDYFPLDVDIDDNLELIEAEHGLMGFALVIKLWQRIYKNGYYINWNKDNELLFSRKLNLELTTVNSVIMSCFHRNIFNKNLYYKYKILTSSGIQKRYITVCSQSKRKSISIITELNLLTPELTKLITEFTSLNQEESAQSKVKESKEKEGEETPLKSIENKNVISEVENTAYMSFASIQDRMLNEKWIDEVIAAKKWNKKTFQRHVFDWLGTKQLSGTYQEFPLGRLKEFCIRDYKPDITEQKLVYKKDPHAKYV